MINCPGVIRGKSIEEDWCEFKLLMENMIDKFVPLKSSKIGKCKWVNKKVNKCRRAKVKAWIKYRSNETEENEQKYKSKLNKSRRINRIAKRNYEQKLAEGIKDNSEILAYA